MGRRVVGPAGVEPTTRASWARLNLLIVAFSMNLLSFPYESCGDGYLLPTKGKAEAVSFLVYALKYDHHDEWQTCLPTENPSYACIHKN